MGHPAPTALFATIRHPKKRAFLQAYLTVGKVLDACQVSHNPHSMHYYWKRTDPAYAEAFAEARTMLGDQLEEVAFERAYAGSDTLLIFLLKGAMPHKYGDKRHVDASDVPQLPDIHVHIHTARERLDARLHHLHERHIEDAPHDTA
jgi:hypothetical protein